MTVDIEGVSVIFPFKPYDQQLEYIKHLMSAVKNSENALLEYPRGGGRTQAALAGGLAWLSKEEAKSNQKRQASKIFFVCRNPNRVSEVQISLNLGGCSNQEERLLTFGCSIWISRPAVRQSSAFRLQWQGEDSKMSPRSGEQDMQVLSDICR